MNCKLVAGLACGMILLLGACSGNPPPPGTSTTPTPPPTDGEDMTGVETAQQLIDARQAITDARAKVKEAEDAVALTAVAATNTAANRKDARDKIKAAIDELAAAETRVRGILSNAEGEDAALRRLLLQEQITIVALNAEKTPELRNAEKPLFWFTGALARQTLARDEVRVPREDVNDAKISRTPRRIPTSATVSTPKDNPDRITANTFEDIPYASGKMVFSTDEEDEKAAHDGTETFKVNAYTSYLGSNENPDNNALTGLRLTGDGLVIRFGGTTKTYPDTIMKLGTNTDAQNTADAVAGSNQWDLTIQFDAPQTEEVDKGVASWTGNGDFYWKAIADADDSQLQATGANYNAGQLPQPAGHKDLGVYEVWLSNHIGVDKGLEPAPDSSLDPNPSDDTHIYLKYAAYGLFLYTADDGLVYGRVSGYPAYQSELRGGRVQSINFGYSAFENATGKKTSDIKDGISGGTFKGETLALAYIGDGRGTAILAYPKIETKLARGDVTLTVNIPKTSGSAGDIKGSITGFQEWDDLNSRWKDGLSLTSRAATAVRGTVHTVYLNADGTTGGAAVSINENTGAFSGAAKAYASGATNAAANSLDGVLNSHDTSETGGVFKGNFYGPRTREDLEVAGSWRLGFLTLGADANTKWAITGSFGAKQRN